MITMEELKRTRDKVRNDFHTSRQPLRSVYREMLANITTAIRDRERSERMAIRRIVNPNGSACARCGDTTVVIVDGRYSFECCETCGHEQNGTTSGEPWNSGMEDYLGIEDR